MPLTPTDLTHQEQTRKMLHALYFPPYRCGYKQLCLAIPYCHEKHTLNLSKDLYPWLAKQFDHVTPQAVEHAIREIIRHAWEHGDQKVWQEYFPGAVKPPSNKQFIATLAERLT